jgi:predicted HAD superfamily Cof-like phosphohydrolase
MKNANMNIVLGKMLDALIEDRVEVLTDALNTKKEYTEADETKHQIIGRIAELLRRSNVEEEMSIRKLLFDLNGALMALSFAELQAAYIQGIKDCQETNNLLSSFIRQTDSEVV